MFNLDNAIAEWRKEMLAAGIKRTSLDELEEHLRSDVEQQIRAGVDPVTAFSNAVARIGSVKELKAEFKKIDVAKKDRDYKIKKGICAFGFGIHAWFAVRALFGSAFDANLSERLLGLAAVVLTGLLLFAYSLAWRFTPLIVSKKMRMLVAFSCAGFGALVTAALFNLMAFRLSLNTAQVIVVVLWALVPMMVGSLICTAILEAADRRLISEA